MDTKTKIITTVGRGIVSEEVSRIIVSSVDDIYLKLFLSPTYNDYTNHFTIIKNCDILANVKDYTRMTNLLKLNYIKQYIAFSISKKHNCLLAPNDAMWFSSSLIGAKRTNKYFFQPDYVEFDKLVKNLYNYIHVKQEDILEYAKHILNNNYELKQCATIFCDINNSYHVLYNADIQEYIHRNRGLYV